MMRAASTPDASARTSVTTGVARQQRIDDECTVGFRDDVSTVSRPAINLPWRPAAKAGLVNDNARMTCVARGWARQSAPGALPADARWTIFALSSTNAVETRQIDYGSMMTWDGNVKVGLISLGAPKISWIRR
jgi:hypothetical protein